MDLIYYIIKIMSIFSDFEKTIANLRIITVIQDFFDKPLSYQVGLMEQFLDDFRYAFAFAFTLYLYLPFNIVLIGFHIFLNASWNKWWGMGNLWLISNTFFGVVQFVLSVLTFLEIP